MAEVYSYRLQCEKYAVDSKFLAVMPNASEQSIAELDRQLRTQDKDIVLSEVTPLSIKAFADDDQRIHVLVERAPKNGYAVVCSLAEASPLPEGEQQCLLSDKRVGLFVRNGSN